MARAAATHTALDAVQICEVIEGMGVHEVAAIKGNMARLHSIASIDTAAWDEEYQTCAE